MDFLKDLQIISMTTPQAHVRWVGKCKCNPTEYRLYILLKLKQEVKIQRARLFHSTCLLKLLLRIHMFAAYQ